MVVVSEEVLNLLTCHFFFEFSPFIAIKISSYVPNIYVVYMFVGISKLVLVIFFSVKYLDAVIMVFL